MLTLSIYLDNELKLKLGNIANDDQMLILDDKEFLSSAKKLCEEALVTITAFLEDGAVNSTHILSTESETCLS
jgi:hypothetical protein